MKSAIKFQVKLNHAFFGDYKSVIGLFGESRSGHPYSYTFRDQAARSNVFGTIGSGSRYLLYVPTGPNDPLVSYASTTVQGQFDAFINSSGLAWPSIAARSRRATGLNRTG